MTTVRERLADPGGPLLRRMAVTGAPNLLAAAVLVLVPVVGRFSLDTREYATWALVSTVVTVSLVVDFGAPAHLLRVTAHGAWGRRGVVQAAALTVGGSLLVGLVGALVWPWYSGGRDLALAGSTGAWLVLAAGGATALRSLVVVLAGALLATGRNAERGAVLLAQALAQLGGTAVLLQLGLGVPSLVLATAASAVPALAWLAFSLHRTPPAVRPGAAPLTGVGGFAATKGLVTLVGLALTQLDRWVVGAVASPATLADYDTSARLASLPRVLVIALTVVLVADASRASGSPDVLRSLLSRATRLCVLTVLVGSVGVVVLAAALDGVAGTALVGSWPLLLAMLAWYGANAVTAPLTLVATGTGRPQLELAYLLPCFGCVLGVWAVGLATTAPGLVVYGAGALLGAWSVWFCLRGPALLLGGVHRG